MPSPIVWWEDSNGNGIPDARFTDSNGDGYLGLGDKVEWAEDAFVYEQTVNEYTASVFQSGMTDWAVSNGLGLGITAISAQTGIDVPGRGGLALLVSSLAHDFVVKTFGEIDFGVMARIATESYADYFNTYNPYDDDDYVPIIGGWHPDEPIEDDPNNLVILVGQSSAPAPLALAA